MSPRAYQQPGLTLHAGAPGDPDQIRALQRDLRALGYLKRGIDGRFGEGTALAVKGLQHDLLHNDGRGRDGDAPVSVQSFAKGRVGGVNGVVDQSLAACIAELMDDPRVPKLPRVEDPVKENKRIADQIASIPPEEVPTGFLVAVLRQESTLMHFAVPKPGDEDTYIVVGTDRGGPEKHVITSRGYGAGQYTLFHHPPRPDEVKSVMLDPVQNVKRAAKLLREKFENFVLGPTASADDRVVEIGARALKPLRACRFAKDDARFMRDCRTCAAEAGTRTLAAGQPVFAGSSTTWAVVPDLYPMPSGPVPMREKFGCDWPYAVRRYNGGGLMSFHYQARVLRFLAAP